MTYYPMQALYISIVSATPFIAAFFVGLRVYARKRQGIALGWDDYLIILAAVLSIALIPASVKSTYMWHIGIHIWDVNPHELSPNLDDFFKLQLAFNLINTPIIPLVKCSILLLLLKVARVLIPIRRAIYCILVFNIVTMVGPWVAMVFFCKVESGGKNSTTIYNGVSCIPHQGGGILIIALLAIDIFTDVLIFPIPILIMQNLRHSTFRSRFAVIFSFALSFGATIIAIFRFQLTYKKQIWNLSVSDWTYDISSASQHAENNAAILLACMPPIRSLILGWTSKSKAGQPPGQTTVENQRIPGESLLFQSLVVHDADRLGQRPKREPGEVVRLPTVTEGRNGSDATLFPIQGFSNTASASSRERNAMSDLEKVDEDETVPAAERSRASWR